MMVGGGGWYLWAHGLWLRVESGGAIDLESLWLERRARSAQLSARFCLYSERLLDGVS